MAFTSRDESVALIGLGLPWMASLPLADGVFEAIDSAVFVYAYRAEDLSEGYLLESERRAVLSVVDQPVHGYIALAPRATTSRVTGDE